MIGPRAWCVMLLACWISAVAVRAHDPGISTAEVRFFSDRLEITSGFAPDDAKYFLPPERRNEERWAEDNFPEVQPALREFAPHLWDVRIGEKRLTPREFGVELLPGDNVSFRVVYPLSDDGGRIGLRSVKLGELPSGHRQFVLVFDERGSTVTKKLMRASDAEIRVERSGSEIKPATAGGPVGETSAPPAEADTPTFWGFLKLGVEHIWTGYDHLLFLFALLVVCRSFRSIVAIVSCFTVAHSITLGLATLDLVNLPARLVEPAIAASIVFVGVENLWRRGEEPRGRWALTFVFGLIHGFGFAGVLRDLGVGRDGGDGIAVPLFSFNLGVELGQVAIAAIVLPLVWWARKHEGFVRRGVPVLSALVAAAGLYWLLERTVLS